MRKFMALLIVNLKAMLLTGSGGGRKGGKRSVSGLGMLALMAFLCLYLSGIYSFAFAAQLAQVGMQELVLMMMPLLVVMMGLLYTVFAVQGVVFGGKDNDLMLALPISAFQLMLARVLALVLENLVFAVFVMGPAGVAYAVTGGETGPLFFPLLVAATLVLSLLPTTLALVIGFLLTWISGKFTRGKALLRNLLYLLFLAGVMALSMSSGFLISALAEKAAGIRQGFAGWGTPFILFQEGVCGNMAEWLGFLAICILPFLLVVWLFGQRYKHMVTTLNARASRSDYQLGSQTNTGQHRALLRKEANRYFRSTMYFFNTGVGLILMVAGAVALLIKGPEVKAILVQAGGALPMLPLLAVILLFCLSMSAIAASSISLEGKNLWILKEAPLSDRELLKVKWVFQLLITVPSTVFSVAAAAIGCALSPAETAGLLLVSVAFALFHAPCGLYLNLCFPRLDAPNDTVVVKQSAAAMLGTFLPLLLLVPGAGTYVLLHARLGEAVTLALFGLLELLAAAIMIRILNTKGAARLNELS